MRFLTLTKVALAAAFFIPFNIYAQSSNEDFLLSLPYSSPQQVIEYTYRGNSELSYAPLGSAVASICSWYAARETGSYRGFVDSTETTGTEPNYGFVCKTKVERYDAGDGAWTPYTVKTASGQLFQTGAYVNKCLAPDSTKINVGGNDLCFNPFALQQAQSNLCPNTEDQGYFFASSQTYSKACKTQDDTGVACGYKNTGGGVFERDFELDCFSEVPPPMIDPMFNVAVPYSENSCSTFGSMQVCPETAENVCSGGNCLSGCGSMDLGSGTEFVCLTGDIDNDGIGDYIDPDLDGDGVANEVDLDADGDGVDDVDQETYSQALVQAGIIAGTGSGSGSGSGSGGSVGADLTETNRLLGEINDAMNTGNPEAQQGFADELNGMVEQQDNLFTAFKESDLELSNLTLDPDKINILDQSFNVESACNNPTFNGYRVDICSRSGMISTWLSWIVAFLTVIFVYQEIHATLRSKT